MGKSFGGESRVDPATMRGRAWPSLRQFCVFLENRVGSLHDLLRRIEQHDLRVMALSIVDSIDFAVARLMLSDYERAVELFQLAGVTFIENDVVGVELPDDSTPYVKVCLALLQAELNVNYTYPLLYRRRGHGAIVLHVDDVDSAVRVLTEKGMKVITESDLQDDD